MKVLLHSPFAEIRCALSVYMDHKTGWPLGGHMYFECLLTILFSGSGEVLYNSLYNVFYFMCCFASL